MCSTPHRSCHQRRHGGIPKCLHVTRRTLLASQWHGQNTAAESMKCYWTLIKRLDKGMILTATKARTCTYSALCQCKPISLPPVLAQSRSPSHGYFDLWKDGSNNWHRPSVSGSSTNLILRYFHFAGQVTHIRRDSLQTKHFLIAKLLRHDGLNWALNSKTLWFCWSQESLGNMRRSSFVSHHPLCMPRVRVKVGVVNRRGLHWNFLDDAMSTSLRLMTS